MMNEKKNKSQSGDNKSVRKFYVFVKVDIFLPFRHFCGKELILKFCSLNSQKRPRMHVTLG